MDPFELLKEDHETVSEFFQRIESASGKAKIGVFKKLKSELDLHAHIEETILYPALEKANETRDLTLEAYEEHKVVKDLLAELDAAKEPSDEWKAKLTVLKENVEHHVDEEENELFDKANDVLTGEEAESLGNRMHAEKVKRGGSAPAPDTTTEKPGLLRTIANALGLGASSPGSSKKKSSKKKSNKKAAEKSAAKSAGSKSTKLSGAASKKGTATGKRGGAKVGSRAAGKLTSARKAAGRSGTRKGAAGKI